MTTCSKSLSFFIFPLHTPHPHSTLECMHGVGKTPTLVSWKRKIHSFVRDFSKHPSSYFSLVVMVALVSAVSMGVVALMGSQDYDLRGQAAYENYHPCIVNSDCNSGVCRTCRAGEVCPDVIGKFCFAPDPTRVVIAPTATVACVPVGQPKGNGTCCPEANGVEYTDPKNGVVCGSPSKSGSLAKSPVGLGVVCDPSGNGDFCNSTSLACVADSAGVYRCQTKVIVFGNTCALDGSLGVCSPGSVCELKQGRYICEGKTGSETSCSYKDVNGVDRQLLLSAFATAEDGKCYTCTTASRIPVKVSESSCNDPTNAQLSCYQQGSVVTHSEIPCCAGLGYILQQDGSVICGAGGYDHICYGSGMKKVRADIPCCNLGVPKIVGQDTFCGPTNLAQCPLHRPDGSLYFVSHNVCYGAQRCQDGTMVGDPTCNDVLPKACYSPPECNQTSYVRSNEQCPISSFDSFDACRGSGSANAGIKGEEISKAAASVGQKYGIVVTVADNATNVDQPADKTMGLDKIQALDAALETLPPPYVAKAKSITLDDKLTVGSTDLQGNIIVKCDPLNAIECQKNVVQLISYNSTEEVVQKESLKSASCTGICTKLDVFHQALKDKIQVSSDGKIIGSSIKIPADIPPTEKALYAYLQTKAILDPVALQNESPEIAKFFEELSKQ